MCTAQIWGVWKEKSAGKLPRKMCLLQRLAHNTSSRIAQCRRLLFALATPPNSHQHAERRLSTRLVPWFGHQLERNYAMMLWVL